MEVFTWFVDHAGSLFDAAAYVIAGASVLANITPTDTDNKAVAFVGKVVNFLAAYWNDPDKGSAKPAA